MDHRCDLIPSFPQVVCISSNAVPWFHDLTERPELAAHHDLMRHSKLLVHLNPTKIGIGIELVQLTSETQCWEALECRLHSLSVTRQLRCSTELGQIINPFCEFDPTTGGIGRRLLGIGPTLAAHM